MMKVSGFSVTRDGEEQTKVDRVIRVTCIVSVWLCFILALRLNWNFR